MPRKKLAEESAKKCAPDVAVKPANESSLMRKTKKELVDIILRKDDVEASLKSDVKNLRDKGASYLKDINDQKKYIGEQDAQISEFKSTINDLTYEKGEVEAKLDTRISHLRISRTINAILGVVTIVLLIILAV